MHDATVVFSGHNVVTERQVGLGGRGVALAGMVTPAVSGGQIRAGGKLIKRFGTDIEDAATLAWDAARAVTRGFPHGVSFTSHISSKTPGSIVSIADLNAAGFWVEQTGDRLSHYTVHLATPVTDAVAEAFNRVLGRIP